MSTSETSFINGLVVESGDQCLNDEIVKLMDTDITTGTTSMEIPNTPWSTVVRKNIPSHTNTQIPRNLTPHDSTDDLTNPKTFRTTMTVQSNLVAHNKIDEMDLIRFLRGADLLNYVKSLHVNFNHTRGLITFTTTPAMEHF